MVVIVPDLFTKTLLTCRGCELEREELEETSGFLIAWRDPLPWLYFSNFLPLLGGTLMDPLQTSITNLHSKILSYLVCLIFEEQSMDWTSLTTSLSSCTTKPSKKITHVWITKDMNRHDCISCWATQSHGGNCLRISIVQSLVLWIPNAMDFQALFSFQ